MFSKKLTKKLLALGAAAMLALAAAAAIRPTLRKKRQTANLPLPLTPPSRRLKALRKARTIMSASISILPVISDRSSAKKLPSPT